MFRVVKGFKAPLDSLLQALKAPRANEDFRGPKDARVLLVPKGCKELPVLHLI